MPAAIAVPALIGAGAKIGGAAIQSHAANAAGKLQADAATRAAGLQQTAANQSLGEQRGLLSGAQGTYAPYLDLGTQAAGQLSNLAQSGFQAPTAEEAATDPGYQFRLAQGQKALEHSAAAHGTLLTGGTAKSLSDYGQNAASQEYGNVYGRRLGEYQNQFGNLSSLLNFGAGQNQNLNNLNLNYAGLMGNTRAQGAGAGATGVTDAANALAAGRVGSANAQTGALTGISGDLQQLLLLQQLLAKQPGAKT